MVRAKGPTLCLLQLVNFTCKGTGSPTWQVTTMSQSQTLPSTRMSASQGKKSSLGWTPASETALILTEDSTRRKQPQWNREWGTVNSGRESPKLCCCVGHLLEKKQLMKAWYLSTAVERAMKIKTIMIYTRAPEDIFLTSSPEGQSHTQFLMVLQINSIRWREIQTGTINTNSS